jgi:outer membrane receptor protein involved in Fe transport
MHRTILSFARLSGSAAAATVIFSMPLAAQAQAATYSFDIPSQDLGKALRTFGRVSRQPVSFNSGLTRGKRSAQIKGSYTVDDGLRALLGGSGLSFTRGASGVLMVTSTTAMAAPAAQGGPLVAQASDSADEASETDIVVTAQKKTELLKNVPASVTAVTADTMQDIGAAKLEDYVGKIPALTVSNVSMASASTQITIRGITTGPGGNPTVGVYVDDSPFGTSSGYGGYTIPDLDPQDLARVEVLRGPQGTLYGAGSLGGLLKYVTAAPDPSRFFGRFSVEGSTIDGGGDGYAVRGSANIPLSDAAALRVSGYTRQDGGYVDNVLTGQKNDNRMRFYGGRASLGLQLGEDWKVRLSALYQHQRGSGPVIEYDPFTYQPLYGDLKQSHPLNADISKQAMGAYSLLIEGNLGDFATLTSATAYNHQNLNLRIDLTPVFAPVLAAFFGIPNGGVYNPSFVKIDKITQELRLASNGDGPLSWQVGGFYTHEKTISNTSYRPIEPLTFAPITGLPELGVLDLDSKFEEKAVFGNITYQFSDAFDVTGGIRYSSNTQRSISISQGILFPPGAIERTSQDNATTFLLNPRLKLGRDTLLYARFATGYRPGGPNLALGNFPPSFGPDRVTNYEVGVKSDLLDRKLSVELSAYYIDWKKIQVQQVDAAAGASYITNGSSATSKGFEASASARPVSGLQLYANLAYQNAKVTQDFPAGGAVALDGDRLPLTPRWSGGAGADYRVPLTADWDVQLGADWRHVGQTLGSFPNPGLPRFVHPSYDVIGLRAGITNDRWTVMAYAKNITDDRGQTADLNLGPTRVTVIQPRTFALSVSTNF